MRLKNQLPMQAKWQSFALSTVESDKLPDK